MRIYADFNAVTADDVVDLHLLGTLRDLCAAQVKLRDGLALTLYTDSDEETDREVEAVVRWIGHPATPSGGYWGGEFDPNAFRDVPRRDSRSVLEWFPCSACRGNLAESTAPLTVTADTVCPSCGGLVRAPLAPPEQGA